MLFFKCSESKEENKLSPIREAGLDPKMLSFCGIVQKTHTHTHTHTHTQNQKTILDNHAFS